MEAAVVNEEATRRVGDDEAAVLGEEATRSMGDVEAVVVTENMEEEEAVVVSEEMEEDGEQRRISYGIGVCFLQEFCDLMDEE